jgi:hypothetical protein
VRIAISGSHRTGKSTLVEDLHERLPDHLPVEEPYHLLEEEGYAFADPPSVEDFEAQLERSIGAVDERTPDVLFDRCPADLLAYLIQHPDAEEFVREEWLPRVRAAMATLDLVVLLRIESPDRIGLPSSEDAELRLAVDRELEEMLLEGAGDLDVEVLEVRGDRHDRVEQVMRRVPRDFAG